jgi:F-type H+-transporting ATPase subunit c
MYKKLDDSTSSTSVFMIFAVITTSVCLSNFLEIFFNFIGVNAMIFNLDSNFLFSSLEENSIDTEIVARRVGSGLATAGLGGVGTGIGLVFSGLIKGFSRNPSLKDDLFSYAIFGFALTEAIGLFALMMAFMLLYA